MRSKSYTSIGSFMGCITPHVLSYSLGNPPTAQSAHYGGYYFRGRTREDTQGHPPVLHYFTVCCIEFKIVRDSTEQVMAYTYMRQATYSKPLRWRTILILDWPCIIVLQYGYYRSCPQQGA
jgi:hypothetical protein